MNNPALEKNCYYEYGRRIYRCVGRGPGGRFGLQKVKGKSLIYLSIADVRREAGVGNFKKLEVTAVDDAGEEVTDYRFSLSSLDPVEQRSVESRAGFMAAIKKSRDSENPAPLSIAGLTLILKKEHERQVKLAKESEETPPEKTMSVSAALRWWRVWRQCGEAIEALVQDRCGNRGSRLTLTQDRLLQETLVEHYLIPDGPSANDVHGQLKLAIKKHNGTLERGAPKEKVPTYRALLRRIKRMDQYEVLAARTSVQYADAVYRTYGVTPATDAPYQRLQMDHTLLDVRVGCKNTFVLRPWLTILYDVHLSAIVGFYLSEEPPSYRSVMECLRMAILPKDNLLSVGDGTWVYPMVGVPQELVVDNGKEFHSRSLTRACAELGIVLRFTPPRQPWFKSQVERTFGVLNTTLLRLLVGRVYKGKAKLKDEQLPLLAYDELHKLLLQWTCTVFHQRPLQRTGKSPLQMWFEWDKSGKRLPLPIDEKTVRLALAQEAPQNDGQCQLGPGGIRLNNNTYGSPQLTMLRRNQGKSLVPVRFDSGDVGRIWVLDKFQRRFFPVPSPDKETHGVSLFSHTLIHRERNAQIKAGNQDCTYEEARDALVQAINDLSEKKRQQIGAKAARFAKGLGNNAKAKRDEQARKDQVMERVVCEAEIDAGWDEQPAIPVPESAQPAAIETDEMWTPDESPAAASESEAASEVESAPSTCEIELPHASEKGDATLPEIAPPNVATVTLDDDWDVPDASITRLSNPSSTGASRVHP